MLDENHSEDIGGGDGGGRAVSESKPDGGGGGAAAASQSTFKDAESITMRNTQTVKSSGISSVRSVVDSNCSGGGACGDGKNVASHSSVLPSDDMKQTGLALVQKLFSGVPGLHSRYLCQVGCETKDNLVWMKGKSRKVFHHDWLHQSKWFDSATRLWWLLYVEGDGMYCLICRKHGHKDDIWSGKACRKLVLDAIKDHSVSKKHLQWINTELLSKGSKFQQDLDRKHAIEDDLIEKAFDALYWLLKEEVANMKFAGLLQLMERVGNEDMRLFNHRSHPSVQEMIAAIGDAILEDLLSQVTHSFGVLADEVCDITVMEQLVVFVKFVPDSGKARTSFLGVTALDSPRGANAEQITGALVHLLEEKGLAMKNMASFVSDGAAVMSGKVSGVATRLREFCRSLISVHCVCHKLALAHADSDVSLKPIKDTISNLTAAWKFFEYSPKRTAVFIHMHKELQQLQITTEASKRLSKKIRKACRTRWLSIDQSVTSVLQNYLPMVNTFRALKDEQPLALGLLKIFHSTKTLGLLYILQSALPIVSKLSKLFQQDALSFSLMRPALSAAMHDLQNLADPVQKLKDDLTQKYHQAELQVSAADEAFLSRIFFKYQTSLQENITARFSGAIGILESFAVFDPAGVPSTQSAEFNTYGDNEISCIAKHFYQDDEDRQQKLLDEWRNFKHNLLSLKDGIPKDVKKHQSQEFSTSMEWALTKILSARHSYVQFFPEILHVVDIVHSAPITNAWPERGASALKRVKTKSRNRLSQMMLNAQMQVSINGPEPGTAQARTIVKAAKKIWLAAKPRRKLPTTGLRKIVVCHQGVQASVSEEPPSTSRNENVSAAQTATAADASSTAATVPETQVEVREEEVEVKEAEALIGLTGIDCSSDSDSGMESDFD